jgi:hypothetical protein
MHAEELRAGHVLRPKSANAPCVHVLFRFVKSPPVRPELVEGLLFLRGRAGQCFDKLSTNGVWAVGLIAAR